MLRSGVEAARGERLGGTVRELSAPLVMSGLLVLAFVVRLALLGADGFRNDVASFESWTLTLATTPLAQFYTTAKFADYPPGYFLILFVVGHVYRAVVHSDPTYSALRLAAKLPAVLLDLVDVVLIFTLVRQYATRTWAFAAAAAFAFNPAIVFISADWGQVDSVPGALTLSSLLLFFIAPRLVARREQLAIVGAWLLLAYSILIKPPALVIVPLYLAYAFAARNRPERGRRNVATALGVVGAVVLAYLVALPFHPVANPVAVLRWLYERYAFASGVYPYNSVNAFNLYVLGASHFWQSDANPIPGWTLGGHVVGLPQYVWGIVLLVAATILVVVRYRQRPEPLALLEGAAILSLGYFVLSTRMHERYIYSALMLAIPLIAYRRRYLYAAIALTLTLLANLAYSLQYQDVVGGHTAGLDATDLMPFVRHVATFVNVATFFYLGYVYLGAGDDVLDGLDLGVLGGRALRRARAWFSPLEGVAAMRPLDWALAVGLTAVSFVLSFVGYTWPPEKIFDEIYYARAGEEYLAHKEIFEFTHPPLTKLVITLSMTLFGGLHGAGDTATGWRFLNLMVGALMVFVMYLFAKRLLGSTFFAAVAAALLVLDGFHFAQSRIATPEITVAFFTLLTLYAFYRFWLASQVRVAPETPGRTIRAEAVAIVVLLALAGALTAALLHGQSALAHGVLFSWLGCGAYALVRLTLPRFLKARSLTSYADGSFVARGVLVTPDGGRVPVGREAVAAGEATSEDRSKGLVHTAEGLRIEYGRGGAMRYLTDAGEATFEADGTMRAGGATIDGRRDGLVWFAVLAVSAGALGASKWNGLFDFFVVWLLAIVVASQRYWPAVARGLGIKGATAAPAAWGNPLGFSVDVVVTGMLFVGGAIYLLTYIPYFGLGHTFEALVSLQQQMYIYHHDTVAHATHPYSSKWWQWPLLQIPISYYYHDFRTGAAAGQGAACCVAEVLALPNPLTWWFGLFSVPFIGWLAWREKNKGCTLLFVAYFLQWLPWIASPRIAFEYHFFPNLAIILLADTVVLARVWARGERVARGARKGYRIGVYGFLVAALAAFVFWYPIVAGTKLSYNAWDARMLTGLEGNNWINPHPGK